MLLARQGSPHVGEEELRHAPTGRDAVNGGPGGGAGRDLGQQDRQAPKGQAAPVEVAQVDAVEALEVGLYGVAVVAEEGEERGQFPETPRAFSIVEKRASRSATFRGFARKRPHWAGPRSARTAVAI